MKTATQQPNEPLYSLIYCRVSSKKQVLEGNGLESQEQRCRDRSNSQNYTYEKTFEDDGISGSLFDRPAMQELLKYIDDHPYKKFVVIFDDLKRFARDYDVHKKLRLEFTMREVKLECLNFPFEDSPEGEFIEGVMALHGQLERKQNKRQVIQKQKARLDRGFWPFCPPTGLKQVKTKEYGKLLHPNEPFATIFKNALEMYARNILNTQQEVKDFINGQYEQLGIERRISMHGVAEVLREELYAGYIEYRPWEVERRKGMHESIISPETYQVIQDKLAGKTKPKLVKSYSPDFPLRRFVTCSSCGEKLRASWNTGKTKKYPNYWCQTDGCPDKYRVTNAEVIHAEFEELLEGTAIGHEVGELAKVIFQDAWEESKRKSELTHESNKKELANLDSQVESLVTRVSTTKTAELVAAYEDQIGKLILKKAQLSDSVIPPAYTSEEFGTQLNVVLKTLENPLLLWRGESVEDKRTILYMYFENGLDYTYKKGFGTPKYSEAINLFRDLDAQKITDVEMPGNEPGSELETALPSSTDLGRF
jgi:site-specific DNA recombinase